ncbi:PadR family transcriptional regulator [Kosmotoga pacifica]|uniref:PadR family transcriptional regulator n=1 Tax=Kosmotoga pacifica TaxID=1330330 RepID=UPI00069A5322|nr:PadR family transcriptional regulator [Kosmotoga pacifica]
MHTGFLKFAVMDTVASNYPVHGYRIMELIEEKTGFKPSPGSIYPILKKLVAEGLVFSTNEGKKKLYSPTEKGLEVHQQLMKQYKETVRSHQQFIESIAKFAGVKKDVEAPFKEFRKVPPEVRKELKKLFYKISKVNWKRADHITEVISEIENLIKTLEVRINEVRENESDRS